MSVLIKFKKKKKSYRRTVRRKEGGKDEPISTRQDSHSFAWMHLYFISDLTLTQCHAFINLVADS